LFSYQTNRSEGVGVSDPESMTDEALPKIAVVGHRPRRVGSMFAVMALAAAAGPVALADDSFPPTEKPFEPASPSPADLERIAKAEAKRKRKAEARQRAIALVRTIRDL
jgi:hypothetical protein